HVAAADEIHTGKRRVAEDVLPREDAHVSNGFRNLVSARYFLKEKAKADLRNFVGNGFLFKAGPRLLDCAFTSVCPKKLDWHFNAQFGKGFDQGDGVGIRFFSSGTSRNPDAHGFGRRTIGEQLGIDNLVQAVEHFRVPKEAGDVNQDIAVERLNFLRIAVQQLDVVAEIVDLIDVHPAQNAAADGCDLVVDEIDFAEIFQQTEDVVHEAILAVEGIAGEFPARGLLLNPNQLLGDTIGRKDVVDHAGGDGAVGHTIVFGRVGVLSESDAGIVLDRG